MGGPDSRQKRIFILGCGIMQIPALRIAQDMGWHVSAADGNPEAEGRSLSDEFYHVDLRDLEGLIQTAWNIQKKRGLDGVFTAGTDFSYSVAAVAQALGLPGHSLEAAYQASDKVKMRQRFREAGVPSPDFMEVGENDDASRLSRMIPGPWVVKPVDSMGARGVVRIDDPLELETALDRARGYSYTGRALLETYMEGPEYSLDALVENGRLLPCGLADRHIVFPPYFIEMGHTIPSGASREVADSLWEIFHQGIQALELTHGAAKGDVKLTPTGPMIGEIAARLSGGYMSGWTWPYASGVQPTRGALRLAVGIPACMPPAEGNLYCAERALIGIDGRVRRLDGLEEALALPGVREVFLRHAPGDVLQFPRNNVEKAGNVIATGSNAQEAQERAQAALQTLRLELDPQNTDTGVYLDSVETFPANVYEAGDYFRTLWNRFPPQPSQGAPEECPSVFFPEDIPKALDFSGRSMANAFYILERDGLVCPGGGMNQVSSDFWKAMVRGGLIGARWYLERRS